MFKLIFFTSLIFLISCSSKQNKDEKNIKKPKMSIVKKHTPFKELNTISSKEIKNWTEYNDLKEFIKNFENISPNDALNNALELKSLSKKAKDSIRVDLLKTRAFRARLNVLENEILRLADMTYIPAINSKEVNNQVKKIIDLFSYLNVKINDIYAQNIYEKEMFNNKRTLKLDSLNITN